MPEQNIIFRLQKDSDLSNSIKHWGDSIQYKETQIGAIKSTNPDSTNEPTSIPSPFARIALAKTAFSIVAKDWDNAPKAYKKIVSDCLDVGELFFNYKKYQNIIEIIEWNKTNDLKDLSNSISKGNKKFEKTLELYLDQDSKNYNFDKMDSIFILKCTHPSANLTNNIIGATSPTTIFFSSANDLSYLSKLIDFGADKPFDGDYKPLNKRYIEYQKYWYLLRKITPNFAHNFPEINAYLDENFNKMEENDRDTINKLNQDDWDNLEDITVGGAGNPVSVLNMRLKQQQPLTIIESDFEIDSKKSFSGPKPLVLPIDRFRQQLKYVTANWNPDTKVPKFDSNAISKRILPSDGSKYPYLTISDFLEDTIVQMPFQINKDAFFESNCDKKGYLLPLKKLFFDYFSVDDLKKSLSNGRKMFEMKSNASGVKVYLRIPVKNGVIEYSRLYFENNTSNIAENNGALTKQDFDFALFPNIKFNDESNSFYRFGLVSDINDEIKYTVECYNSNNEVIKCVPVLRNLNNTNHAQCHHYYLEKKNFDYFQISINNISGVIIPSFVESTHGSKQLTFAVDLGTTNTHVEYSIDGNPATALNISNTDRQVNLLSNEDDRSVKYELIFDLDLLPGTLGDDSEFSFPIRTALSEANHINWKSAVYSMVHANIPFVYERRPIYDYNRLTTNLKWSDLGDENDNKERIKTYIESLFIILRNKVILNNGNLEATKIVWFYPISMTQHRFSLFKTEWEKAYKKYFGSQTENIIPMTESVAPYEFYKTSVSNASDMVTVDIGGGTTDIVIAQREEVKFITSFRFAADSIFGDGYATNRNGSVQNGIIRQFKSLIFDVLKQNEMGDLINVYSKIDNKNASSEIASFLFSLNNNKKLLEKSIADKADFNKLLMEDGKQKIVFVFFYTTIIYHLAHILKAKNLPMPRHITFSGNGSKVIRILSPETSTLEKFTKLIFQKIFQKDDLGELTIEHNSEKPKEATCKGGISSNFIAEDYSTISSKKVVLKVSDSKSFVSNETYGTINEEDIVNETVEEIKRFIEFTLELNNDFSFKNNFGVEPTSIDIAKEECFKDLKTYTHKGIDLKKKEVSNDDVIEETFFFYPLTGMLHALSNKIFEKQDKKS